MENNSLVLELENPARVRTISKKLSDRVKFGLYDNGNTCYFEDGMEANYDELWSAIRTIKKLEKGHKKTLAELYPDIFIGTFSYKFSKYRFTKKILGMIFGVV